MDMADVLIWNHAHLANPQVSREAEAIERARKGLGRRCGLTAIYSEGHVRAGCNYIFVVNSVGQERQVEPLALGIVEWHKTLAAGGNTCAFRDSAFADDVAKTNLAAILSQNGIVNVRSL